MIFDGRDVLSETAYFLFQLFCRKRWDTMPLALTLYDFRQVTCVLFVDNDSARLAAIRHNDIRSMVKRPCDDFLSTLIKCYLDAPFGTIGQPSDSQQQLVHSRRLAAVACQA